MARRDRRVEYGEIDHLPPIINNNTNVNVTSLELLMLATT